MFDSKQSHHRRPKLGRINLSTLLILCFVAFSSAEDEDKCERMKEFKNGYSRVVRDFIGSIKEREQPPQGPIVPTPKYFSQLRPLSFKEQCAVVSGIANAELEDLGFLKKLTQFGFSQQLLSTLNLDVLYWMR